MKLYARYSHKRASRLHNMPHTKKCLRKSDPTVSTVSEISARARACASAGVFRRVPFSHCQRGYLITYVNFYFPLFVVGSAWECIHDLDPQCTNTPDTQPPSVFEPSVDSNSHELVRPTHTWLGAIHPDIHGAERGSIRGKQDICIRPLTT